MARLLTNDVNLAAIAEKLGISISTVSRALRNASGIRPGTRRKIIEMAAEMGYTKGSTTGPAGTRSLNVLALAQCIDQTSDQEYLAGISKAAIALNISIFSHHVSPEGAARILEPSFQPTVMRNGTLDGIVLMHRWDHEIVRRLAESWPVVSIIHAYRDLSVDMVGADDRSGMETLSGHLAASGHQRIGFFGFCREVSWSRSRYAAYVESQFALELPFDPHDTVSITLDEALAPPMFPTGAWADQVMARYKKGVKAWIAPSIGTVYALCQFFLNKGIDIPGDVVLAGFHKGVTAFPNFPKPTIVDVASDDLGAAALRRLVHRVQNPAESTRTILLPSFFVQGDTTQSTAKRR